jgi:hypothetical protein
MHGAHQRSRSPPPFFSHVPRCTSVAPQSLPPILVRTTPLTVFFFFFSRKQVLQHILFFFHESKFCILDRIYFFLSIFLHTVSDFVILFSRKQVLQPFFKKNSVLAFFSRKQFCSLLLLFTHEQDLQILKDMIDRPVYLIV